jgi:nitroimidazol reductase NimA-like FMN-containing flavoprotein (pyridoxamine 5'-phosphate oxidase superfamily)
MSDELRAIVDANRYMTLATAGEDGRPWATPVWFASDDYRQFFWVSKPNARHSRNLAARPELGIVIYDSSVPVGGATAVYLSAVAEEVADEGLDIFNRRGEAQGLRPWTREDVLPPARHRLYRATAGEHFVLTPSDERLPVRV